jgi:hypothetical protein
MKPIPQIAAEAHAVFLKELDRAGVPDLLRPSNGDAWEALPLSWQLAFIAAATHTLAVAAINPTPLAGADIPAVSQSVLESAPQ